MTNPFAALAQPLASRPGTFIPRPSAVQRGRAANAVKKERRHPKVANPWALTGTEWAAMQLLVMGKSQTSIAKAMFLSPKTICTHLLRARQKMGAETVLHAALIMDRYQRAGGATPNLEVVLRIVDGRPSVELRNAA